MIPNQNTDDRLLGALLRHGQDSRPAADTEPAEDLFELFIEGRLPEGDQEEFFRYLDANPEARRAAGDYLRWAETAEEDAPPTIKVTPASTAQRGWGARSQRLVVLAMAACLLLALGISTLRQDGPIVAQNQTLERSAELISDGQFEEALRLLDGVGADSARGQLLAARATMQEPSELSEPGPWSLLSYGYELGDAVPMDGAPSPEAVRRLGEAVQRVATIDEANHSADMARAWLALKQNDADAARAPLDRVLADDPDNAAAHLANGVALFMVDDLTGAEAAFRRHLELTPDSFAGTINLAKCQAELGEYSAALETLRSIDPVDAPSDEVRSQIEVETRRLDRLAADDESQS